MKKAVISSGGRQFLVSEGDVIDVNKIEDDKTVSFSPLLIIDGDSVAVGKPTIEGSSVKASVQESHLLGEKVIAIRYKAKKRVKTVRGHRQSLTRIKITSIK